MSFVNVIVKFYACSLVLHFAMCNGKSEDGEPLVLDIYNPGESSVFPVSSEIIFGPTEAVLIDAQFERKDAKNLVSKIKSSGKKLTTVYISHGDPDYYFGLDVINEAFPDAKIIASPATIAYISSSKDAKLAYWSPILKDEAPKRLIVPSPVDGDSFQIDGYPIEIKGMDSDTPYRTFLWISKLKAIIGPAMLGNNMHVWLADDTTPDSRTKWIRHLLEAREYKPKYVIPGHFYPGASLTIKSIDSTIAYIQGVEEEAPKVKTSEQLKDALKKRFPNLKGDMILDTSCKVLTGEMKWHKAH